MSADIPTAFPDYDAETLDALLIDPEVQLILDDIKKVNQNPMSHREVLKQVAAFDVRWNTKLDLMGENVVFSGWGNYLAPATETDSAELIPIKLDEVRAVSHGFTQIERKDTRDEGGLLKEPTYEIALLLAEKFENDNDEELKPCPFAVRLDEVETLNFEAALSLRQAETILDYYIPELRGILDEAIFGPEDEIDATKLLGEIVWDMSSLGSDRDRVIRALNIYIQSAFQYDELPYVISAGSCDAIQRQDDGSHAAIEISLDTDTLIIARKIVFANPLSEENDTGHLLIPYLDCVLHEEAKHEKGTSAMLPVHAICNELVSSRSEFYNSAP